MTPRPPSSPPRAGTFDQSLELLADPYRFIGRTADRLATDVFRTRLLLQPTLCLRGARAAALFYDKERFVRAGAAPEPVRATLFGKTTVQNFDGAAHLARKRFFLRALAPEAVAQLVRVAEGEWDRHAAHWAGAGNFAFYPAVQAWLADSVCAWAGVPWPVERRRERTRQLVALFDRAASSLRGHLEARRARGALQAWLGEEIAQVRREGAAEGEAATLLHASAGLHDGNGSLLPPHVAAAELLNVLRPTVAVSVYAVFVAHALHAHPAWKLRLAGSSEREREAFVQEVRRFYPFFPAVAARVARDFEWEGMRFRQGTRALLDLYGTNHDPRHWDTPQAFLPQRFLDGPPGLFEFIPQGGARAEDHHRCPGEGTTRALMQLVARRLAQARYEVPPQALEVEMGRLPALPASRMRLASFGAG